jgi:hypothetical protein
VFKRCMELARLLGLEINILPTTVPGRSSKTKLHKQLRVQSVHSLTGTGWNAHASRLTPHSSSLLTAQRKWMLCEEHCRALHDDA